MNPAIRIGKFIREQGWKTLVPEFGHCASACLLIWAAGIPRLFGPGAILGAHCVTTLENPTQCYEPGNVRYMEMPEEFIELHRKTALPIVWVPLDTAASALAIERAIVCMQKYPCTRRRHAIASADFEGFLHTATSGAAPGFFYARSWMWRRPALGSITGHYRPAPQTCSALRIRCS